MEKVEQRDLKKIKQISARAADIWEDLDRTSLEMDIESVQLTSDKPINLDRLLNADELTFMHDISGIIRHMERIEFPGHLTGCFMPRCSRNNDNHPRGEVSCPA